MRRFRSTRVSSLHVVLLLVVSAGTKQDTQFAPIYHLLDHRIEPVAPVLVLPDIRVTLTVLQDHAYPIPPRL